MMDQWNPATDSAKAALFRVAREALDRVPGGRSAKAQAGGTDQTTVSRILSSDDPNTVSIDRLLDVLQNLGYEIGIEVTPTIFRDPERTITVSSNLPDPSSFGLLPEHLQTFGWRSQGSLLIAESEDLLSYAFAVIMSAFGNDQRRRVLTIEQGRPRYYISGASQLLISEQAPFERCAKTSLRLDADLVALKGMENASQFDAALELGFCGQKTIIAMVATSVEDALEQLYRAALECRAPSLASEQYAAHLLDSFRHSITATRAVHVQRARAFIQSDDPDTEASIDTMWLDYAELNGRAVRDGRYQDAFAIADLWPVQTRVQIAGDFGTVAGVVDESDDRYRYIKLDEPHDDKPWFLLLVQGAHAGMGAFARDDEELEIPRLPGSRAMQIAPIRAVRVDAVS